MSLLDALRLVDRVLAAEDVPPMSGYWWGEARRFYGHPSARLLVECVGRGGDKSRTSTKMAIAECLAGPHRIPPGERHYYTHVAENREEAAKTLGVLERYLRILRIPYTRSGDTLELAHEPRGIKVLACRVGAVSGWRCFGWTADECAKWDNEGRNPSAEVIASIRAMTVTHPGARGRMFSSPLGTIGYFHDMWSAGDSADQLCGHAASWVANPSVTEASTRQLERNPRKWQREYAAIPTQDSDQSLFTAELLARCTRADQVEQPRVGGVQYVAACDPAINRNAWTLVIAGRRLIDGRYRRTVSLAREWKPSPGHPLDPMAILNETKHMLRAYGLESVYSDQAGLAHVAYASSIGVQLNIVPSTNVRNTELANNFLTRLMSGELELPPHSQLLADLMQVRQVLTPNGFTIRMAETPDGRHADYAPSVMLATDRCVLDQEAPTRATEAAHRAHWDLANNPALDPGERECLEGIEQGIQAEWSERLFEASYGITSAESRARR